MKLLYFIPLFFISTLAAQNWSPVNLHDVYNYKSDATGVITHSIWVDSVKVEGADSVFYLNRVVRECDTCQTMISTWCHFPYFLRNQPQFLLRKITKSDQGIFQFIDPDTFEIHSQAKLNDTWVFDSVNQVTGTITFEGVIPYLGTTDSAKVISLSDGGSILFSKNHGILTYPQSGSSNNYQMIGIEGSRSIGDTVMNANGIFDFKIGDVFQYQKFRFYASGGNDTGYFSYVRDSILSRRKVGDTLVYEVETYSQSHDLRINIPYPSGVNVKTGNGIHEIKYLIKPGIIPNGYPSQYVIGQKISLHSGYLPTIPFFFEDFILGARTDLKEFGIYGGFCTPPNCFCIDTIPASLHPDFLLNADQGMEYARFAKGLGMVSLEAYAPLGYYWSEKMIGYKRNGQTFGTVYSTDFEPTSISDEKFGLHALIFPNPAAGLIHFSIGEKSNGPTTVDIYSASGKKIFYQSFPPNTKEFSADLSHLTPGIYLIRIEQNGKYHSQKIVLKP